MHAKAIDCYFEGVLGLPIDGRGGSVRTRLRLEAQPPFLTPSAAMTLSRGGALYRSLSPDLPKNAEEWPMHALCEQIQPIEVFSPPVDWKPAMTPCAQPLDNIHPASGGLPPGGKGYGVLQNGRFIGWAISAYIGTVWNVTVQTDPLHRKKGVALHCLSALTADLIGAGHTPIYLCEKSNAASRALALSAGYLYYGDWIRGFCK